MPPICQVLLKPFARAMDVLSAEARQRNEGTDWVNYQPIVTLLIDTLASFNYGGSNGQPHTPILVAYGKVREIAEG
jgi:hypothetical protein